MSVIYNNMVLLIRYPFTYALDQLMDLLFYLVFNAFYLGHQDLVLMLQVADVCPELLHVVLQGSSGSRQILRYIKYHNVIQAEGMLTGETPIG